MESGKIMCKIKKILRAERAREKFLRKNYCIFFTLRMLDPHPISSITNTIGWANTSTTSRLLTRVFLLSYNKIEVPSCSIKLFGNRILSAS